MNLSFSPKTLTRKENERERAIKVRGEKVESQPRARRHINRRESVEEAGRKRRGPCKGKNLKKISKSN